MVVGGKSMDLIKLFLNVKKKGGYNRVTENGLWNFVAKECDFFDASDGLSLKLVYVENLEKIFESLKRVSEEKNVVKVEVEHSISDTCGGSSMNLEPFLSEVSDIKKKKDVNYAKVVWDECDSDYVKFPEMVYCHDSKKSNEDIENYHMIHDLIDLVDDINWGDIQNVNEECDASGGCSMDGSSDLEPFLSEVSDTKKKNDVNYVKVDKDEFDSDGVCVGKFPEMVYCLDHVESNDVIDLVPNVNEEDDASYGGCSMDLSSNSEPFLSEVSDIEKKNDPATYVVEARIWDECDSEKLPEIDHCYGIEDHHTSRVLPNNVKEAIEFKPIKTAAFGEKSKPVIDTGSDLIRCLKRKRKSESAIGILDWIHKVARDPCEPGIGSLPECSEWKDYATDVIWKQVLLIHEAMLLKRNDDSNGQHFTMQKRQKMNPTMYDEPEKFRHSQRIHSATDPPKKTRSRTIPKSSSLKRDNNDENTEFLDYLSSKHDQIRVNIGKKYQADVPEWTEKKKSSYEVDSKWSGTPIWPLGSISEKHNKNLIEREPLGKGRSDSCGCQFSGSTECVRFHVSEKCKRLKLELGVAFYLWRFNRMGEGTSVTWTKEEENKFLDTWKLSPKPLLNKSRALLVNYYFNVYLLRRRGEQNRISPNNITSDDEDDEDGDADTVSERVEPTTVGSTKKTVKTRIK